MSTSSRLSTDRRTASQRITAEVMSWPGVEAGPGRRGEFAFTVGRRAAGPPPRRSRGALQLPQGRLGAAARRGADHRSPGVPRQARPGRAPHRQRGRRRGRDRAAAAQLRPRDRVSPVRTIEVTRFGGPEVLELRERPDPVAAPGQVVIDVAAIPASVARHRPAQRQGPRLVSGRAAVRARQRRRGDRERGRRRGRSRLDRPRGRDGHP